MTVESVPIGQGKRVVHVRVPLRDSEGEDGPAWEALLAGGRKKPIFAGMTGPATGRSRRAGGQGGAGRPERRHELRPRRRHARGPAHLRAAGDAARSARALPGVARAPARDGAAARRRAAREAAESIVATEKAGGADPPLARLLVARGSSVPGSRGAELTDGDPQTVWREQRPGHRSGRVRRHGGAQGRAHHAHADHGLCPLPLSRRPLPLARERPVVGVRAQRRRRCTSRPRWARSK